MTAGTLQEFSRYLPISALENCACQVIVEVSHQT